ncbi:MAG: G/U mismatch-specific DNA glycosylase [Ancalomicrobiaceae bacterium]|nr:G/U mismatch-specific DNA glycosylase [Ancalomicrobiaceae bacterium]
MLRLPFAVTQNWPFRPFAIGTGGFAKEIPKAQSSLSGFVEHRMASALPDIISERLAVVFCGINPGMTAAAAGHHFAGRSNRFWRVIHLAGFTPDEILPNNDRTVLQYGCGLTTVVERPTARADQLSAPEFRAAATHFEQKIKRYAPRFVGFLGKAAYSILSDQRDIAWGPRPVAFGGAAVWVLPNPSGRNRAFTLDRLVSAYRQLYLAAATLPPSLVQS